MTAATATPDLGQLQLLDLSKVEVSKFNPRRDVGDLTELAQSIGQIGVLEPIVVVQRNGHYEAIAGSRRLAASRQAGKKQIPARIMSLDDAQQAAAALIENLQRKDLTPLEEAEAYRKYIDLTGVTQKELGQKIGRAPSTIANALRLLEAPAVVQKALANDGGGKGLTAAHARVLLEVRDDAFLEEFVRERGDVLREMTVGELKEDVDELNLKIARTGPPAIAQAKAALERAQAEHPKAVFTWRKSQHTWIDVVDLVVALGKPPKRYAGPLGTGWSDVAIAAHDKGCECRAYELVVDPHVDWRETKTGRPHREASLRFETKRVCVDVKTFATLRKNSGADAGRSSERDKLSDKDRERLARERAKQDERDVTEALKPARPTYASKSAKAAADKLRKATWSKDAALLIAYRDVLSDDFGALHGVEQRAMAWERLQRMKPAQLQELVIARAAVDVAQGWGYQPDQFASDVAKRFGVTLKVSSSCRPVR